MHFRNVSTSLVKPEPGCENCPQVRVCHFPGSPENGNRTAAPQNGLATLTKGSSPESRSDSQRPQNGLATLTRLSFRETEARSGSPHPHRERWWEDSPAGHPRRSGSRCTGSAASTFGASVRTVVPRQVLRLSSPAVLPFRTWNREFDAQDLQRGSIPVLSSLGCWRLFDKAEQPQNCSSAIYSANTRYEDPQC